MNNFEKLLSSKKAIGKRFKIFRQSIGKSQTELSQEIGVTQPTITRIENGEHRPTFKILSYLIANFNLNFQWLSSGIGNMFTNIEVLNKNIKNKSLLQTMLDDMNTDTNIMKTILERYSELKRIKKINDKKNVKKDLKKINDKKNDKKELKAKLVFNGFTYLSVANRFAVSRSLVFLTINGKQRNSSLSQRILKFIKNLPLNS